MTSAVPTSAQTSPPTLIQTSVIYEYNKSDPYDSSNEYGFNHAPSITRLADGRLLTAWFSGPFEASNHQVILGAYSDDMGATWGEAAVLQDERTRSDFDPAFISTPQASFLFYSVGRWNRYPFVGLRDAERREVGVDSYRLLTKVTRDGGDTWSGGRQVLDETGWGSRSNGIVLANGDLVLPIYHFKKPFTAAALISSDHGETWKRFGDINTPEQVGAAEPTLAQLPDGELLMALRTYDGKIWFCRSMDHGRTWSQPEQTDITAPPTSHFIMTTTGGKLVMVHNPSEPPTRTPLTLRTSTDAGRTWGEPLVLDKTEDDKSGGIWSRQVCYPSAVELEDGTLAVTWAKLEIGNRHQFGVIHYARVRLQ